MISYLIIYITKLLDSYWLKAVLFFCKESAKKSQFRAKIVNSSAIYSQNSRLWLANKQEDLVRTNQTFCFGGVKLKLEPVACVTTDREPELAL